MLPDEAKFLLFAIAAWIAFSAWPLWQVFKEHGLTSMDRLIWSLVCIALPLGGFVMFLREHQRDDRKRSSVDV